MLPLATRLTQLDPKDAEAQRWVAASYRCLDEKDRMEATKKGISTLTIPRPNLDKELEALGKVLCLDPTHEIARGRLIYLFVRDKKDVDALKAFVEDLRKTNPDIAAPSAAEIENLAWPRVLLESQK
jgi:hypothetical protein